MVVKGRGNQWEKPGFSVFMNTDGEEKTNKCLRCKKYKGGKKKCKPCEFDDRGYVLIERRHK
jgi:hypothetical protein